MGFTFVFHRFHSSPNSASYRIPLLHHFACLSTCFIGFPWSALFNSSCLGSYSWKTINSTYSVRTKTHFREYLFTEVSPALSELRNTRKHPLNCVSMYYKAFTGLLAKLLSETRRRSLIKLKLLMIAAVCTSIWTQTSFVTIQTTLSPLISHGFLAFPSLDKLFKT